MAVTFVGAAAAESASVTLPSWQAGDVAISWGYATSGYPGIPDGWTPVYTSLANPTLAYRVLQTGDTTVTWTSANATKSSVFIYRGADTRCPFDRLTPIVGSGGSTTSYTAPAANPAYSTSLSIHTLFAYGATTADSISLSGWTNRSSSLTPTFFGLLEGGTTGGTVSFSGTASYSHYSFSIREASSFPFIADQDTKSGTVTSNATDWTLTYPTNIAAGDLLIGLVGGDGGPGSATWPSGWWENYRGSGANFLSVAKKSAVGTESGTFTLTLGGSEQGSWIIYRIPAGTWEGTLGTAFNDTVAGGSVQTNFTFNIGTSANPDPSSLDPSNWGTENTLWLAATSVDTSRTFSAYPTTPSTFTQTGSLVSGGSTGASLGYARLESAASSVDPGTFTISASDDWVAATIAIRPKIGTTVSGSLTANAIIKKTITSGGYEYDSQTTANSSGEFGSPTYERLAQSVLFSYSGTLDTVSAWMSRTGTLADNLVVELYSDSSGLPGSLVGTIATVAASTIATSSTKYTWNPSISVSAGTYWITMRRSGAVDASNYLNWWGSGTGDLYPNGRAGYYNPSAWGLYGSGIDHSFETRLDTKWLTLDASINKAIESSLTANAIVKKTIGVTASPIRQRGTAVATTASGTQVVANLPSGMTTGDLMIAYVAWDDTGDPDLGSNPSGWTLSTLQHEVNGLDGRVYWKYYNGSETTVTIQTTVSTSIVAIVSAWTNDAPSTLRFGSWLQGQGTDAAPVIPTQNASFSTYREVRRLGVVAHLDATTTVSPGSSGATEIAEGSVGTIGAAVYDNGVQYGSSLSAIPAFTLALSASEQWAASMFTIINPVMAFTASAVIQRSWGGKPNYAATVLADSPAAYYRFGDAIGSSTADNAQGNAALDGSLYPTSALYNGFGVQGAIAGDDDTAYSFHGNAGYEYFTVTDNAALDVGDVLSIEFWIKRGRLGSVMTLFEKGTGTNSGFAVWFNASNLLQFSDGAGNAFANAGVIDDFEWHHVVLTKNGSTRKCYVDGLDVTDASASNRTLTSNASNLTIGATGTGGNNLIAVLDEVAIYGTALTAEQVKRHFAVGAGQYIAAVKPDSPIAHWRLGEKAFTPFWACGFEDATIGTHWRTDGGSPVLDSTVAGRTGTNAVRFDIADTTDLNWSAPNDGFGGANVYVTVVSFRMRFSAMPTGDMRVFNLNGETYYNPYLWYEASSGWLIFSNGGTNGIGPPIVANTWYQIDILTDGANKVGRWMVDGIEYARPGAAANMDRANNLILGKLDSLARGAFSIYYDDIVISHTASDFPIGRGQVNTSDVWESFARDEAGVDEGIYVNSPSLGQPGASGDGNTAANFSDASLTKKVGGLETTKNAVIAAGVGSLEAWVNLGGLNSSDMSPLGWGDGSNGFMLYLAGTNWSMYSNTVGATYNTDGAFNTGWHHLVGTYDSSNNLRLYIDGVLVAGPTASTDPGAGVASLEIGNYGAGSKFIGAVDEAAVYTTALSAERVLAHFAAGKWERASFTADAVLVAGGGTKTGTVTANAVIKRTQLPTFSASAVIKRNWGGKPNYATGVLADSAVAYWTMGEASGNVVDLVAGHTGSVTGTPTYGVTGPIAKFTAIELGGTGGNYFSIPDHADLDLGDGPFTIEMWYARLADLGSVWEIVLAKGLNAYNAGVGGASGAPFDDRWMLGKTGVTTLATSATDPVPADGSWNHWVITRSGTGTGTNKIYRNGVEDFAYENTTVSLLDTTLPLVIGRESASDYATGRVAHIALYKSVLTAVQIADHYSSALERASFSAQAVLVRSGLGTPKADAIIKRTQTGSGTANAVIKRTQTGTGTANAVIRRTQAGTATANAVIKRTQTGTATANSVIKRTQAGSATANAVVKRTQSATVSAGAIVRREQAASATADAVIKRTQSFTFKIGDSVDPGGAYITLGTQTFEFTRSSNAVLRRTQSSSATANAVILRTQSGSATANAVVFRTQSGSATANAVIKRTQTGTGTANAIVLRSSGTKTSTADAIIRRERTGSATANAVIKRTQLPTSTANAVIKRTQAGSATANAVIRRLDQPGTGTANAVILRSSGTKTGTADAVIRREQTGSATANAVIFETVAATALANAVIVRTTSTSVSANAVIFGTRSGSKTADAVVKKLDRPGSATADAVIRRERTGSLTANAVVFRARTSTLTSNAVIFRVQAGSGTANAVVLRSRSGSASAAAVILRSQSGSYTTNAVVLRSQPGATTANAVVRRTTPGSATADAVILRERQGSLTTDAIVLRGQAGAASANALINSVAQCVWTTPGSTIQISPTTTLNFLMPIAAAGNMHFEIQIDAADTFDSIYLRIIKSHADLAGWEFWDGGGWQPIPQEGVPNTYCGNEARYTIQTALTNGTWYRRVRAGVI